MVTDNIYISHNAIKNTASVQLYILSSFIYWVFPLLLEAPMVFNITTIKPGILSMQEEEGKDLSAKPIPFYQEIWSLLFAKEGGDIINTDLK